MKYLLWRCTSALVRALPLRVAYALATLAGSAAYLLWPRGRRATLANYRVVLGGDASATAVARIARRSFVNYCRYLVDFARFPAEALGETARLVDDRGAFAKLAELRARHGAVIIASIHFGNWDAGAVATARAGFPVTAMADGFGDPRLDAAVFGARERGGLEIVRADGGALGLVRALRKGRNLLLIVDRPLRTGGVEVDFFGRRTRVPGGAARLALRTGTPVIAAACYRVKAGGPGLALWTDFAIPMPANRKGEAAVQELTQSIFSAHERAIRQRPAQWYMFREMWPRRGER